MKNPRLFFTFRLTAIAFVMAAIVLASSCKKDDAPGTPSLSITSFDPKAGATSTVVTITGTGFDADKTKNAVKFGTVDATVLASTPTSIIVSAPAGITGAVKISVTVAGVTKESTDSFTSTSTVVVTVKGNITADTQWTADKQYLIVDKVYVKSGTLTIAPGTIVKGDATTKGTLIIEPGAKINAAGTATNPIIFTSSSPKGLRDPGDWGGVVIAGKAKANNATDGANLPKAEGDITTRYSAAPGQQDDADNSGVLKYVRIEFGGVPLTPGNELNGLSLYAVGSGTEIDHVQVSYSNDDSFEWFGGTVSHKYLIAYAGLDDDFDTDNGFSGHVQFGVGIRNITQADQSGSKGFESDNDDKGTSNLPKTSPVFSNMTLLGPSYAGGVSNNYISAIHIRRNSALSLFNSLIAAWPAGVLLDAKTVAANAAAGSLVIKNNVFAGIATGKVTYTDTNPLNTKTYDGQKKEVLYYSGEGGLPSNLSPTNTVAGDTDSTNAFGTGVGANAWFNMGGNKRVSEVGVGTKDYASVVFETAAFAPGSLFGTYAPNFVPKASFTAPVAAFTDAKLTATNGAAKNYDFLTTPTYIGAFSSTANWATEAWINWNPQNSEY